MITLLFLVIILVFACLLYAIYKRNEMFKQDDNTSASTIGVGSLSYFYKCDDPLKFDANGVCIDDRKCPPGTSKPSGSKFCVKDNVLKYAPTEKCTCPLPNYGFAKPGDSKCTEKVCLPNYFSFSNDGSCMLNNDMPAISFTKLPNSLIEQVSQGNVRNICKAPEIYLYGFDSNVDPGYCIKCPEKTWPKEITSSNDKPICTNDTGIAGTWTKTTIEPSCSIIENFANLANPKTWNRVDEQTSYNCGSNTWYNTSYKQCYKGDVKCDAGWKQVGNLSCGISGVDVKTKCSCPSGYGFSTVDDIVCKAVTCSNGDILNNQLCESRAPVLDAQFPPNYKCSESNLPGYVSIVKGVKFNKRDALACVKCPTGMTPLVGGLDSTGKTSTFYCKNNKTYSPFYSTYDTKDPTCI